MRLSKTLPGWQWGCGPEKVNSIPSLQVTRGAPKLVYPRSQLTVSSVLAETGNCWSVVAFVQLGFSPVHSGRLLWLNSDNLNQVSFHIKLNPIQAWTTWTTDQFGNLTRNVCSKTWLVSCCPARPGPNVCDRYSKTLPVGPVSWAYSHC